MARIPEQQVTRLKTEVSIVRLVEAAEDREDRDTHETD